MVALWAFVATAVAIVFAEATLVRWTRDHRRYDRAWTVALAMYAIASAALATGESTGWDAGTFRVFYLFGAVLNAPWLALGTLELLGGPRVGRAATGVLLVFSGLAAGVVLASPLAAPIDPQGGIPSGRELFEAGPRVMAAIGSGIGATIVLVGAVWSTVRYLRHRTAPRAGRLAVANSLIAIGVILASSGGLLQAWVSADEAFAVATAVAVIVIYVGFLVATRGTPVDDRGSGNGADRGAGRELKSSVPSA